MRQVPSEESKANKKYQQQKFTVIFPRTHTFRQKIKYENFCLFIKKFMRDRVQRSFYKRTCFVFLRKASVNINDFIRLWYDRDNDITLVFKKAEFGMSIYMKNKIFGRIY